VQALQRGVGGGPGVAFAAWNAARRWQAATGGAP
jgi:hypothetical protein